MPLPVGLEADAVLVVPATPVAPADATETPPDEPPAPPYDPATPVTPAPPSLITSPIEPVTIAAPVVVLLATDAPPFANTPSDNTVGAAFVEL